MEYPPQCGPVVWGLIQALKTGQKDETGTPVLSRAVTDAERQQIYARRDELSPWMTKADYPTLKGYVVRMLIERGKEREKALARAGEFVKALGSVPSWAANRACDEFGRGVATAELIEDGDFVQGAVPEPRHIAHRARLILRPFQREWESLLDILRGVVGVRALSADDRKKLSAKFRKVADQMMSANLVSDERLRERARSAQLRLDGIVRAREWQEAGVEPPSPDKTGYVPTLALCIALGGRVQELEGKRRLTMPVNYYGHASRRSQEGSGDDDGKNYRRSEEPDF